MAFSTDQTRLLASKLNGKHVRTRTEGESTLSYVEGWHVLAEANRIFGFEGWDRETLNTKCVWETFRRGLHHCAYSAQVRIRVRAGGTLVARDGNGVGLGAYENPGLAHERALKEAETDATKRALATFGNLFGLALYDKHQTGVSHRSRIRRGATDQERRRESSTNDDSAPDHGSLTPALPIVAADGQIINRRVDPRATCRAIRELMEASGTLSDLQAIWRENAATLADLRRLYPALVTTRGKHFVEILNSLYIQRCAQLQPLGDASITNAHLNMGKTSTAQVNTAPRAEQGSTLLDGPPSPTASLEASDDRAMSVAEPLDRAGPSDSPASPPRALTTKEAVVPLGSQDKADTPGARPPSSSQPEQTTARPNGQMPRANEHATALDQPSGSEPPLLPRRLRDRDHLRVVARQPCLVCGRNPSHAHHLRFAQPRALGLKPGDEWAVPLCHIHHRAVHLAGNEPQWWTQHNIDPIAEALRLWEKRQDMYAINTSTSDDRTKTPRTRHLTE